MSLIDHLTPSYYRVSRMGVQRDGEIVASYDVAVLNADGTQLDMLGLAASLTAQEKADLAAIFLRDKAAFETNTGLTEWQE